MIGTKGFGPGDYGMPLTWPRDPVSGLLVGSDEWLRDGREMTVEDLGLSEYDISDYAAWLNCVRGDAPYAFWLGAEG